MPEPPNEFAIHDRVPLQADRFRGYDIAFADYGTFSEGEGSEGVLREG